MEDNNTTQSNIEKAEAVSNILQFVVNTVAKQYGGLTGQSFSNFLTGKGGLVISFPRSHRPRWKCISLSKEEI